MVDDVLDNVKPVDDALERVDQALPRRLHALLELLQLTLEAGEERADPRTDVRGLDAVEGREVEVGEQRVAAAVGVRHGIRGGGAVGRAGGGGGREGGRGRGRRGAMVEGPAGKVREPACRSGSGRRRRRVGSRSGRRLWRVGSGRRRSACCGRDESVGGWRCAEARRHGWGARDARVWKIGRASCRERVSR